MSTHRASVVIAAPIEKVYGFHRVVDNITRITPPGTSMRVEQRSNGDVTLHIGRFGVTRAMTVRFVEIDPPNRLVDEQISGPFRSWRQTRLFERVDEGTRMTDIVEYELGFGAFGRLLDRLLVAPQIAAMFRGRQRALRELLEREEREEERRSI